MINQSVPSETSCISAIITTYRRPQFVRDAIDSVLAQSLPPAEVLLLDNDTAESGREIAKAYPSIEYVAATSVKGVSHARNAGAKAAASEWLAFLDDDDIWLPNYLEQALNKSQASGAGMVLTPLLADQDGDRRSRKSPSEGMKAADLVAYGNIGVVGSNTFVRRSVFDLLGGYDEEMPASEDIDFLARALLANVSYALTEQPLVVQRLHSGNRLSDRRNRAICLGNSRLLAKHGSILSDAGRRRLRGRIHSAAFDSTTNPLPKFRHLLAALRNGNRGPLVKLLKRPMATWRLRRPR